MQVRGQPEGNCPEMPIATKCGQCRFRLRAEKINKLARNIITYFVIELIMTIGALVFQNFQNCALHLRRLLFEIWCWRKKLTLSTCSFFDLLRRKFNKFNGLWRGEQKSLTPKVKEHAPPMVLCVGGHSLSPPPKKKFLAPQNNLKCVKISPNLIISA